MDYKTIIVAIEEHVATLTFNRPDKMNAFNKELELEMQDALDRLEQDSAGGVVIINGAGKCFSSGFDISASSNSSSRTVQQWRENVRRENDTWFRIWRSRLPFIAAVHGYCLGGACELSMVCDFTIAGESAQFG